MLNYSVRGTQSKSPWFLNIYYSFCWASGNSTLLLLTLAMVTFWRRSGEITLYIRLGWQNCNSDLFLQMKMEDPNNTSYKSKNHFSLKKIYWSYFFRCYAILMLLLTLITMLITLVTRILVIRIRTLPW